MIFCSLPIEVAAGLSSQTHWPDTTTGPRKPPVSALAASVLFWRTLIASLVSMQCVSTANQGPSRIQNMQPAGRKKSEQSIKALKAKWRSDPADGTPGTSHVASSFRIAEIGIYPRSRPAFCAHAS